VIRDVARQIAMGPDLAEAFAGPLALARRVKDQRPRERGRKVSSLHAPEVECIGQGKAPRASDFYTDAYPAALR
jgi:transposase, IS5 family